MIDLWEVGADVYNTTISKGFIPTDDGVAIALIHSELSECLEGMRAGNPPDDKIPEFSNMEAELADVVLRVAQFAYMRHFNLEDACKAKAAYNKTRPERHGGKAF